jgi:GNAT superfamily N-acetyltransferase
MKSEAHSKGVIQENIRRRDMTDYMISMDDRPCEADIHALIQHLVSFNETKADKENWQHFAIFIRDEQGEMMGGLYGYTHWDWLFISHLWLSESLRGQGYGKELVLRAEQIAVIRGCRQAHVDTFDFQALGFYQKLGYQVFGFLDGFPKGTLDISCKSVPCNLLAPIKGLKNIGQIFQKKEKIDEAKSFIPGGLWVTSCLPCGMWRELRREWFHLFINCGYLEQG